MILNIISKQQQVNNTSKKIKNKPLRDKKGGFSIIFDEYNLSTIIFYINILHSYQINSGNTLVTPNFNILNIGTDESSKFYDCKNDSEIKSKVYYKVSEDKTNILLALSEYGEEKKIIAKNNNAITKDHSLQALKKIKGKNFIKCECPLIGLLNLNNTVKTKKEKKFNKVIITENLIQYGYNIYAKPKHTEQLIDFNKKTITFS